MNTIFKWLLSSFLLYLPAAYAIETINFTVDSISAHNWTLSKAELSLSKINSPKAQFSLSAQSLKLPKALENIQLLQVQCLQFSWQAGAIHCQRGKASLHTKLFKKQNFDFSLHVKNQQARFTLRDLHLFGGKISLSATEKSGHWQANIHAKQLNAQKINRFVQLNQLESLSGTIESNIQLKGDMSGLEQAIINALITQLSLQDKQGQLASEDVSLQSSFTLTKQAKKWQWQTQQVLNAGAIYIEPVYLELNQQQAMRLSASGELKPQQKIINIQSATLNHLESSIHAKGNIAYQQDLQLNHATIDVHSKQLNKLSSTYLSPFIEGSELEGLSLTGELSTHLEIKNNALQHSKTQLNSVVINDSKQRFHAQNLAGTINWSPALSLQKTSSLNWQSLHIKGIPFDKGAIHFSVSTQHISLLNSPKLALLDGTLNIEQFEFKKNTHQGPTIHLRARLNDIALDKLSMAMGWENTLSGTMNGYIPSVTYQNKTLKLNGRLKMQLFDGEVTITQLASSGLFTDFSRFYITLDFDNLDLNQVTKKFKVGNIQGRLSGFAHDVYLENWQPVRFFAWLGTPENDSSKHLISHKAVRNIASLGGSNAADAISRGVLSWFDDFNYQKLGIGCYLHDGVCQLMGASAAKKGYYLVQGKSIPRIDIIGFNTRVDWHTLLNRLERITSPDEIIIDPSN